MFKVKNHLLFKDGQPVAQNPSPNHGGAIKPRLIVIHYTGDNSLEGALSWLCAKRSGVSAHLVIAKDGRVFQLLPFNVKGWHAGQSSYEGETNVNSFSIGIENVGVGDNWPEAQVDSNREVVKALFNAYAIEDVRGHNEVAPGRKLDPGPRYPWDKVIISEKEPEQPPTPTPDPAPIVPPAPSDEVEIKPLPSKSFMDWLWRFLK